LVEGKGLSIAVNGVARLELSASLKADRHQQEEPVIVALMLDDRLEVRAVRVAPVQDGLEVLRGFGCRVHNQQFASAFAGRKVYWIVFSLDFQMFLKAGFPRLFLNNHKAQRINTGPVWPFIGTDLH
jgi:hypothetical protein